MMMTRIRIQRRELAEWAGVIEEGFIEDVDLA